MLSPSSALVQFVDPRALRTCSLVLMVALYAEYMCLGDTILSGTATAGLFALLALSVV
jgi:hypothetical protein